MTRLKKSQNMIRRLSVTTFCALLAAAVAACGGSGDPAPAGEGGLSASPLRFCFASGGGSLPVSIEASGSWSISDGGWCRAAVTSGGKGTVRTQIEADANGGAERTAVLSLTSPGAAPVSVTVVQDAADAEPVNPPVYFSDGFMKGSTMCFAQYMQDLGLTYRENGEAKDPYESLAAHGANIVRLQLNFEDFTAAPNGSKVDWASWDRVLADAKRAAANRMDVLLTLKPDADDYSSATTVVHNLVPAAWTGLAGDETRLGDALYKWVYSSLCALAAEGIYPRVVAVGNEVNINFLGRSAQSDDASRTGRLLGRGFAAVRDYAARFNPGVKTLLHIADPSKASWYARTIADAGGGDFDILGVSWYPGYGHKMGSCNSFAAMCSLVKESFGCELMVLETAYTFTDGTRGGRWMGDWCDNSYNYPAWSDSDNAVNYTPAAQRAWLRALAEDIGAGGGAGLVTWGTESLPDLLSGREEGHGTGMYTYPAAWAYGSTWENNSYWDFTDENNLHEGIDWMLDVR